jgi:conjugal transfer pilin signal peptidase TrbI
MPSLETSKSSNREKQLGLLIFFVGLIAGGSLIPSRIAVTLSDSLDHRIFFVRRLAEGDNVKRNDYVMFPMTSKFINHGKTVTVTKKVVCAPGEVLSVQGKTYYCDNRFLGIAKEYSLKGERAESFVFNGRIPPNSFFVMGESKDSYDSRYEGLIKRSAVNAIAYPIF